VIKQRNIFIHMFSHEEQPQVNICRGPFGTDECVSNSYTPGQASCRRLNTVLANHQPVGGAVDKRGVSVFYDVPREAA